MMFYCWKKLSCGLIAATGALTGFSPESVPKYLLLFLRRLILFDGEATPQIVMGISAKAHNVINIARARRLVPELG